MRRKLTSACPRGHSVSRQASRGERRQTRVVAGLLLGVILGVLLYYWLQSEPQPERPLPAPSPVHEVTSEAAQLPAEGDVPPPTVPAVAPQEEVVPLPPLDESDDLFAEALSGLFGDSVLSDLLRAPQLVRKGVIIVDNLTDRRLPVKYLPLRPPAGPFRVREQGGRIFLDPTNYARYRPYVDLLARLEPDAVKVFLRRYGPWLQAAYEELGYPEARFEERLMAVIDVLLQTPEVTGPVELVQPSVHYKFADPTLEALSSGQKALLRMGPENARRVKEKLRQLRAALQE